MAPSGLTLIMPGMLSVRNRYSRIVGLKHPCSISGIDKPVLVLGEDRLRAETPRCLEDKRRASDRELHGR
jgi:hypothetical protein